MAKLCLIINYVNILGIYHPWINNLVNNWSIDVKFIWDISKLDTCCVQRISLLNLPGSSNYQ